MTVFLGGGEGVVGRKAIFAGLEGPMEKGSREGFESPFVRPASSQRVGESLTSLDSGDCYCRHARTRATEELACRRTRAARTVHLPRTCGRCRLCGIINRGRLSSSWSLCAEARAGVRGVT